jgi:uncharacterized protein (TIGR01244 family)
VPPQSVAFDGIVNFTRVTETVACGGATEPFAIDLLAREGFRTVVNTRLAHEPGVADEAAVVTRAGMAYHHLPLDPDAPDAAIAERFLDVLSAPTTHPVYIHCASANRVGALWAIKRVVQDGWDRQQAIDEGTAIGLRTPLMLAFVHQFLDARGHDAPLTA